MSTNLQLPGHNAERRRIEVAGGQHLVQLRLFLLQCVCKSSQLAFQEDILQAALLLYLVDGFDKLFVKLVAFFLYLQRKEGCISALLLSLLHRQ